MSLLSYHRITRKIVERLRLKYQKSPKVLRQSHFQKLEISVKQRLPKGDSELSLKRASLFQSGRVLETANYGNINYDGGNCWTDETDRSLSRHLHGMVFLADWPQSIRDDSSGSLGKLAYSVIMEWNQAFQTKKQTHSMAFHDETTAQRLINTLAIYIAAEQHLNSAETEAFRHMLDETASLLADDDFHSTGNNHGMFQDQALINYTAVAQWRDKKIRNVYFNTAARRIKDYFLSAFTEEGVHIENTPTYHLMVCWQLQNHCDLLRSISHPDFIKLKGLLDAAGEYAMHCTMPNGQFPPISDTTQKNLAWNATKIFHDDNFDYAVTQGTLGTEPLTRTQIFEKSGYLIYRSSWTDINATFLMFQAAYNADYHKHSDDLSIYIRSRNMDLITESGPNGYNYKDPFTKYAYSQFAHNNIVVNGRSVPRTDDLSRTVSLSQTRNDKQKISAQGQTGRLDGVIHTRQLEIVEVDNVPTIDIIDLVRCPDGKTRQFEMLWNLGHETTPFMHGQGFELHHRNQKVFDAHLTANVATAVRLHRGLTKPRPLGWRFPKMGEKKPNNVVSVKFSGSEVKIVTKFRLDNFSYKDRGLARSSDNWQRFESLVTLNYMFMPAQNREGRNKLVVVFSAIAGIGDFTYNYKSSLHDTGVNALFILDDFGDQGSYYLMDHGDMNIFHSVQQLIKKFLVDLDVRDEDLITVGSSKGGTAALIHGLASSAGQVFVGAPQTRIGTFIAGPHPNMLEFMTGSTCESSINRLDSYLYDLYANTVHDTEITIVVGESDHHYRNHVLPFADYVRKQGKSIRLIVLPGTPHAEIGAKYRKRLTTFIKDITSTSDGIISSDISTSEGSTENEKIYGQVQVEASVGSIRVNVDPLSEYLYAFTLFDKLGAVSKVKYSQQSFYSWTNIPPGDYRIRIYWRTKSSKTVDFAESTSWSRVI